MIERSPSKEAGIDGRSPIRAAVLVALLESPGYGWNVAKRVNRRMGSSWEVPAKHIYPFLRQLVEDGLARSQKELVPESGESRTVFYPTEKAEQARKYWLATPLTTAPIRTDLEARLVFSTEADAPDLLRALHERRTDILEEIEENEASQTPRLSWRGTTMSLQRSAVEKRLKAELEWIEEACRELNGFGEMRSSP